MSHLTRDERLLALDQALEPLRRAHLDACLACRSDVEALASVVDRVKAVDVPEPSPLFWDHLAARVGEAIAREPVPERPRWWAPRPIRGVAVAALVLVALAAGLRLRPPAPAAVATDARSPVDRVEAPVAPGGHAVADGDAPGEMDDAMSDDAGWQLIAAMADGADLDTFATAGGSELSIAGLSADERAALARELEAMLQAAGAREG
jgi:hypothetical protein